MHLDRATYTAVKAELASGRPVLRHSATGKVVPAHLQGTLYSVRDLHASAFAEIDAQVERISARRSPALKMAAE
jgi:hypothetical protein